jgi:hypothetical protein
MFFTIKCLVFRNFIFYCSNNTHDFQKLMPRNIKMDLQEVGGGGSWGLDGVGSG